MSSLRLFILIDFSEYSSLPSKYEPIMTTWKYLNLIEMVWEWKKHVDGYYQGPKMYWEN